MCLKPVIVYVPKEGATGGIYVPCGKCVACRKGKINEWSVRIIHEAEYWKGNNCFITLTYADECLPIDGSLNVKDVQLFLKRLRKKIGDRKIKYYITGEYGDENWRPHYHALFFGIKQDERELLLDCWKKGFVDKNPGYVSIKSAKYVMKYINKNYEKKRVYELAGLKVMKPLMSKGIGKQYALDNRKNFEEGKAETINGVKIGIPRYYCKILDIPEEVKKKKTEESMKKDYEKMIKDIPMIIDDEEEMYEEFAKMIRGEMNEYFKKCTDYHKHIKIWNEQKERNLSRTRFI